MDISFLQIFIVFIFAIDKIKSQNNNNNAKVLGFKNNPKVRAECSNTNMFVYVDTSEPFSGIINARGHRDSCFQLGDGVSRQTVLIIPLLNTAADPIYCAQQRDLSTGEYKVYIDVHAHKILELENDKTFLISCSQNGVLGNGSVHFSFMQNGNEVSSVAQGDRYVVQIVYTDSTTSNRQLDVTNCLIFGRGNSTQQLSDGRGCPVDSSPLGKFSSNTTTAVALIEKMIKFQDSNQLHIQCDVGFCRSPCPKLMCPGEPGYSDADSTQKLPRSDGSAQGLAGATIAVTDNGNSLSPTAAANQCGYGEWVLALCITFGILFLIMLIVNIIMCTAVSCNFTRKDRTEEVHHDAWGEYDTVKNVWSNSMSGGSIPGDRHSMHSVPVGPGPGSQYQPRGPSPYYHPRGLAPGPDDTEIREVRPYATGMPHNGHVYSDHYAMVHRNGTVTKQ